MFRAVVLSTLLTLVIGQNAAALCSLRCEPRDAATAACGHRAPVTPQLFAADDNCTDPAFRLVAFVREDAPRASSGPSIAYVIGVRTLRDAASLTHTSAAYERGHVLPGPPLDIALRV